MWKFLVMVVVLLAPMPAAAQADLAKIQATIPAIDRIFADFQQESHAPGLVYGIVADGQLVHVRSFGVQDLIDPRESRPLLQRRGCGSGSAMAYRAEERRSSRAHSRSNGSWAAPAAGEPGWRSPRQRHSGQPWQASARRASAFRPP